MSAFAGAMGRRFAEFPPATAEAYMQNARGVKALVMSSDPFPRVKRSKLKRLKVPTLIVTGEHTVEIHNLVNKQLAILLPLADEVVIPHSGHGPSRENSKDYNAAILRFLK
jgi:pimeloyl-ACP methyl ester carboxylesterase